MRLIEYSPAEGALVDESRKRAVSDEYRMFYSWVRRGCPLDYYEDREEWGEFMHRLSVNKMEKSVSYCFPLAVLNAVLHAKLFLSSSLLLRLLKVRANYKPNSFSNWIWGPANVHIKNTLHFSSAPSLVPHQGSLPNCIITCCSQSRTFVI